MPQLDSNEIPVNTSYNPGGATSSRRVDRIVEEISSSPRPVPVRPVRTVRRRSSVGIWSVIALIVLAVIYFFNSRSVNQSDNGQSDGMNGTIPVQTSSENLPASEPNTGVEIFTQPEQTTANESAASSTSDQAHETEAYSRDRGNSPDINTQQRASDYRRQAAPPVTGRQVQREQEEPARQPLNPYHELKQSFQQGEWRD